MDQAARRTASPSSPAPRAASAGRPRSAWREAGAHVVALARTQGGARGTRRRDPGGGRRGDRSCPLDLKDFDALDRLGAAIHERWGKLDILIGNAGILGKLSPLTHIDQPVWDEVMAVNVTANWRLIRSLDPLLRASDAGRAIFVTSGAARKCTAYWGPYSISKAALEALVRTYAAETADDAGEGHARQPRPPAHRHARAAMPGEDPMTLKTPGGPGPPPRPLALAGVDRDGEDLRFPAGPGADAVGTGLGTERDAGRA